VGEGPGGGEDGTAVGGGPPHDEQRAEGNARGEGAELAADNSSTSSNRPEGGEGRAAVSPRRGVFGGWSILRGWFGGGSSKAAATAARDDSGSNEGAASDGGQKNGPDGDDDVAEEALAATRNAKPSDLQDDEFRKRRR
jgi:hypothetical protein